MHTAHAADELNQRIHTLVTHFEHVQHHRMKDVPLLNPALHVEAVGFEGVASEEKSLAMVEGVLITPWFMSLCRLPLAPQAHHGRISRSFVHAFGLERFDFIGAHDPALGYYETCALFSPMFEFSTQALARDTAHAALKEIRQGVSQQQVLVPDTSSDAALAMPSRRAFFLRPNASRAAS
jgi:[NiFe] hydrogenase assembly HybE family chaperone